MLTRADAVQAIDLAPLRLLRTVDRFSDQDIERPSSLLGWTRGHVLAHVAQTADAMRNLLVWARTGCRWPPTPVKRRATPPSRRVRVGARAR